MTTASKRAGVEPSTQGWGVSFAAEVAEDKTRKFADFVQRFGV
jgi:hypothetical protein